MDQLAGLPQLPLSSNDIGSQASRKISRPKIYLARNRSKVKIIQLSFLKNWNDLASFNCVGTGSPRGSNLTSCKKWLGEQETTLERHKVIKVKYFSNGSILQGESSGRSTPNSDSAPGKLFVGGLSWQTNQERLREYFGQFGTVTDVLVMKDPITQVAETVPMSPSDAKTARGTGGILLATYIPELLHRPRKSVLMS